MIDLNSRENGRFFEKRPIISHLTSNSASLPGVSDPSLLYASRPPRSVSTHEPGTDSSISGDGRHSPTTVPSLCGALRRRVQSPVIFLLGAVSGDVVRATYIPGEPARHRGLSEFQREQLVPPRLPKSGGPQHAGRRQRAPGLANLCGSGSVADPQGPTLVRERGSRLPSEGARLRFRFHHHRFVPQSFPLGPFPTAKRSGQAAHLAGLAGFDSHLHRDH